MPPVLIPHAALKNRLLATLPASEFEHIRPSLKPVSLEFNQILHESGNKREFVYFPTTAVVTLLLMNENGATVEVGMVGNEGILGIEPFMGGDSSPCLAVVHVAGWAYRLRSAVLKTEFAMGHAFQNVLLRYTQALITQISQTSICGRFHAIPQQLARWLLLCHDRLDTDDLALTHDNIAHMLGVRRESVTMAAAGFAHLGLIKHARGVITILDRPGLELAACACYDLVYAEYDRLLNNGH